MERTPKKPSKLCPPGFSFAPLISLSWRRPWLPLRFTRYLHDYYANFYRFFLNFLFIVTLLNSSLGVIRAFS